jgi:hypothetical protein
MEEIFHFPTANASHLSPTALAFFLAAIKVISYACSASILM